MTPKPALLLLLVSILAATAAAQNSKQELNDQFWDAVRKGDAASVATLLDKGADVNAKFRYGATALFKAAERGHTEVVRLLLARGADATVRDTFYGATAMTWALDQKHVDVVEALLEKDSASVGDVLSAGVNNGNEQLVRIALQKGGLSPTALTAALVAASDNPEAAAIAEMLKKAGAPPPLHLDETTLQSYAGKYRPTQGNEMVLTVKDGKLLAAVGGGSFVLMPLEKTVFRPVRLEGITISFESENEKVTGATLKQGQNTTKFTRVEDNKPQ